MRRRRRRRGSGTKRRRGVFFGGGSNSSHSSINSDMAYGTGFVKKEKDRSTRYSSSVAGSAASSSHPQQQLPYSQYPAAVPNRPSPRLPKEAKRDKTDEEIIAIGRQLSDLARRSNEEDLRHAGKSRPSGLASTAAAISALRKSRKEAKKRRPSDSKKHRNSSSDESDWESASDDDDSSSGSSSSDDSLIHLAYGGDDSSRSNVALSGSDAHLAYGGDSSQSNVALPIMMGAAAGASATPVADSNPSHSRKSSVVDPRLFGPLNSLRGLINTPCGFGDEPRPPHSTGSGPHLYDNDRPATGGSQADSAHRPAPVPLQQPIPKAPVSSKVFQAGRRDSRNSYRRQKSDSGVLDPTLGGGVAAAAAAAAARMADQRGPWSEDRIYRDDVKLTRPDPDEDYFQRDQAPFEELERRRANPEVYYNRRNDDVDSPRMESNREVPDYFSKDSPGLSRDGRTWMELHPEERKESLKYQTTYDAHMREIETRQAQERKDRLRDAQRQQEQQQQQQQTARATKAGDRIADKPAQPAPKPNVDPFQYQVADDAFGTPQFNTPRRPLTPEIVTVERVPHFTESRSATASAPSPAPSMSVRPPNADIRLSRKDSHEIEKAAEERQRGIHTEFRGRDPRAGYEYEQESREARSILDEAKHSTIPVAAVAIASAIAVEEERSRERRRREYSEDGSRDRSRAEKDVVQEDADRYYRESVIARKIASDEIRSRSKSPEESVVDKWESPSVKESFAIVSPPSMEDREHDDDENPYAPPNADVKVDNEIYPHETGRFRAANGVDASRLRTRDVSRERPLLNIVRPTPVPSPAPTSGAGEALKQPAEVPAPQELPDELADSSEDEESDHKEEAAHSSPSGKSVSWGENSTKRFVVESPEARSRAESPNEPTEQADKPRPRLSKISQWGKIAAMMAAGTAEPTTELDRHTAKRSGDTPADDNVEDEPPVPGPKLVSPEPEQMPGAYADDLEFAATVAAGLKESGFDPNIVIDDPAFRRRGSRPATNEDPVMDHAVPERTSEKPVSAPLKDEEEPQLDLERSRQQEDEGELSLTDTEDEEDEKTQKQGKLDKLEKFLQMRQSGEIKPPSPPQEESAEPRTTQDRPVTPPPRGNERRNILENLLRKRQSGEIQPPREVLEAVESRNQPREPETTEPGRRRDADAEQPPAEPLEQETLAEADDSASDVAPAERPKKRKSKMKRRDRLDEASTISSRLDDDQSRLSIPGDEGSELYRVSVPGDEASDIRTVFSVEDWEDWDSSPRSTRKSLVASELSTSSRRSTRGKHRSATERDIRESRDEPDERGSRPEVREEEREPRNREARHYQDDDNNEKPAEKSVPSRQRKDSGKKSKFLSGIFKSGNKNDNSSINEKGESFFEKAGTLGAGAGLASIAAAAARALTRSNAADVSSDPENISRDLPGSSREDEEEEDHYPVIAPRAIAIDPQYGDLLPLPPSLPGTPVESSFDELPGLPDSRPGTPVEDRSRRFEESHRRQRSNQENNLSRSRNRSHSNTAVPLTLLRGIGSRPSSPVTYRTPRTPPRPTSWDSTKEFMPLMLLEQAGRGSNDRSPKGGDLPPLPPSEATSEAEGGAMSDHEGLETGKLLPALRAEDFRSPLPPNDGFNLADRSLRLQTQIPAMEHAVSDEESLGSTPKADVTYELPVHPVANTLGEATVAYEDRLPGPRTAGNDRPVSADNYDEAAPVEPTPSPGHSARTVDAQALPSPPTPTQRFLSPRQDIVRQPSDDLTSPDERSDAFETAHTSPAAIPDDDQYEPDLPPIEPSMLGAIPEFSRPAKFFEDKVPDHPELASMDRVIETLPSIESVPKDQARADALQKTAAEGSSDEGGKRGDWKENKSISSGAEFDRDVSAQPGADETSAAFVGIPESAFDKDHTLDTTEYISSTESFPKELLPPQALEPAHDETEEHTWVKKSRAQPVMVEDGSEPEPEQGRYTPGPELEWKSEPVVVFEPLDEVAEASSSEAMVDIVPVSDEASSNVIAESSQPSVPEEVEEEIVIGTRPAATRDIIEAGTESDLEVAREGKELGPTQHDARVSGEEDPRKSQSSAALEDSEESEEEDDSEDEEDDSGDSEDSEESEEEEEEERARHAEVAGPYKREGEEQHVVRDMTASIETLGAGSVVSTSSKKSKKKKKKKKKRKRKKKKSKSATAAAAEAAEASQNTPIQHTTESTKPAALPVVEPISDVAVVLPAELEEDDGESLVGSVPPPHVDAVKPVEETPVDLPEGTTASEPAQGVPEQLTRDIEEEPSGEQARDAVASPEPTTHESLETAPEHTILADTEEPHSIPLVTVEETNNEKPGVDDELQKWAADDSEPVPHADRVGDNKSGAISPELGEEQEGQKSGFQVEDEAIATEKPAILPPLPEELPQQEESPLQEDTSDLTTVELPVPAESEDGDSPVRDRETLATEEMPLEFPAVREELVDSETKDSGVLNTHEQAPASPETMPSADHQLAVTGDEKRESEEMGAAAEYEEPNQLPTIMEEPALEDAISSESENFVPSDADQHAPVYSDQLSPILEELMEDLLDEAAPVEKSEEKTRQDGDAQPEPVRDDSGWSIGHSEDQFEHRGPEEGRVLESIAEEPEDDSLEPTPNQSASRTIGETADGKDADWVPTELPSFASEIYEPLFSQGDAPSEYPTQQYSESAEPTQMEESFAVPEEPLRPPPPVPNAVDEANNKAAEPESLAPMEPVVDAHPEYPTQQYHDHAEPTQMEEPLAVPEEPMRPPPPVPKAADENAESDVAAPMEPAVDASPEHPTEEHPGPDESTQMDKDSVIPEEPVRPPPPVPNAADEADVGAIELESSDPTDHAVDSPALERSDLEAATTVADNAILAEERDKNDEQLSTPVPEASLREAELNEAVSPEEERKDGERNESSAAEDNKAHDDSTIEQPSSTDLDKDGVPRELQTTPDSNPSEEREEGNEATHDGSKLVPESESVLHQETSGDPDLEREREDEAVDHESKLSTDDSDVKAGDSEEQSTEAQAEFDPHLAIEPSVELPSTQEVEHAPAEKNNDNTTLDTEKTDESAEAPGQSAADSAATLEPSVGIGSPQESDMTPELDQSTAPEVEAVASPATPADADEKVELERSIQPQDFEQLDLAQDDAATPVSTAPQDSSEDLERAGEAEEASPKVDELQTEDGLVPQEAQTAKETELDEPTNEAQESSVAGSQSEMEAPADIVNDELAHTTMPGSDPEATIVDKAGSEPAEAPDSEVPETTLEVTPTAEDKEVAQDESAEQGSFESQTAQDLQPEVHSTVTDTTAELQPESKAEDLPLEQARDDPEQKPDEPQPEPAAEEAGKELETGTEEIQVAPIPEEHQREPQSEVQEEPILEEPKLDEPQREEAVAEQERVPDIQEKEADASRKDGTGAATSDTAQADVQPTELDAAPKPHVMEPAADPEQLPPTEAVTVPTEEPSSTERSDQREPESALAAETQAEPPQESTERPEESTEPADSEARQPKPVETRSNSVRSSSIHLTVPGQEEDSGSEYGSDDSYDASSVASDMSYQRDFTRSGSLGPNDSSSRLTGFEVTASPRVEGHAHRDRHRKKKKKKKGKSKHKRKKSRGGSDPSSSLTSLSESVPTTSNPSLGDSVPSLSVEPPADEPQVPGQSETGSVPAGSEGLVPQPSTEDDLFSRFSDEPELSPSEQEKLTERAAAASPDLPTILEEVVGEEPQPKESTSAPDNEVAGVPRPSEEPKDVELKPVNKIESNDREAPAREAPQEPTASAPLEDDSDNKWDMFTGNWGNSSGRKTESGLLESPEITRGSRKGPEDADGSSMHIIQDAPLVEEPSEISTPQRMSVDIPETAASGERAASQLRSEKRASSVPGSQSPKKGSRPASQGGEKSDRWFGSFSGGMSLFSDRFGSPRKKKAKDRDKDSIGGDDKGDSKEESFLGNPALRQSGDERSWESNQGDREDMIDDFLHGGGLPTTPKKRRKRHDPSVAPTTPKRSESIVEAGDEEGAIVRKGGRGGLFGGDLVESPVLEATEPLGPFELLRRHSQAEDPVGGLLRDASEISLLPPMDMMSELSDYELSDYRLSPPRGLPAVEEQPEAEAEATASEVGFYRDSGFDGSPPPNNRSRRHSITTIPLEEDEEKQCDSGVDADWLEAAMAQLKTPEPINRTPERQPQRRLRRSTLGGQRLRDSASLREAAQESDKKTIPGTRERVLTGTGTRPETPTGRSSPTKKGYGAIVGMGLAARLASGRTSPITASTERSDTLPALRRSVTSPAAAPLRSLRRAVSAQIGPGLQRPESPSLAVLPVVTEQPRSVSDSHIPSATKNQAGEAARADPGRGTPNSGAARQRTPERLKSSGGSTVRSSSNPSPPLLRRAEKRMSLRQPGMASTDLGGFDSSSSSAPLATRNPNPSTTSIANTISPIPTPSIAGSIADSIAGLLDPSPFPASSISSPTKPPPAAAKPPSKAASEPPVANESRLRAKEKTDVYVSAQEIVP